MASASASVNPKYEWFRSVQRAYLASTTQKQRGSVPETYHGYVLQCLGCIYRAFMFQQTSIVELIEDLCIFEHQSNTMYLAQYTRQEDDGKFWRKLNSWIEMVNRGGSQSSSSADLRSIKFQYCIFEKKPAWASRILRSKSVLDGLTKELDEKIATSTQRKAKESDDQKAGTDYDFYSQLKEAVRKMPKGFFESAPDHNKFLQLRSDVADVAQVATKLRQRSHTLSQEQAESIVIAQIGAEFQDVGTRMRDLAINRQPAHELSSKQFEELIEKAETISDRVLNLAKAKVTLGISIKSESFLSFQEFVQDLLRKAEAMNEVAQKEKKRRRKAERKLKATKKEVAKKDQQLHEKDQQLDEKDRQLDEKDQQIDEKDEQLEEYIQDQQELLAAKDTEEDVAEKEKDKKEKKKQRKMDRKAKEGEEEEEVQVEDTQTDSGAKQKHKHKHKKRHHSSTEDKSKKKEKEKTKKRKQKDEEGDESAKEPAPKRQRRTE